MAPAARRAAVRGGGPLTATVAAVLAGPRRVEVTTVDIGRPGPGEVVVAIEGCGVCGSNLPLWEGRPWFEYPLAPGAPGHEAWGSVEALGPGVAHLRTGDRVAVLADRGFASRVVAPAATAVPLPPALDGKPFPGEALGCGFNVAARSGFEPGQRVAVVGVGFLGAVVVALAARAGATVVALARRPFALEIARLMGAHHTITLTDRPAAVAEVNDITGGDLCDVVVEAVGAQDPLDLAAELTRVRGRLVIAGYHQDSPRSVDLQLWNWRGIDVVNAHERDPEVSAAGIRAAVDAVASGGLDPSPLYTHQYPLDSLSEAFDALSSRPEGFMKALVHP